MSKKFNLIGLWLVVICLTALSWPFPALAADITLPEEFYGNITINNQPAPAGTTIIATIDGVERGIYVNIESGKYGDSGTFADRLIVKGVQEDIGKDITFWVNGFQANQTVVYEPGQSKQQTLSFYSYPLGTGDIQITRALDYLRGAQQPDGSIGSFVTSGWATIAIAAVGQNPSDWTSGNTSVVDYLKNNGGTYLDRDKATDWERSILAIVAAGENPRDFGGINYVDELLSFYQDNQMGDPDMLNDDYWGILALTSIGESPQFVQNMKNYIINHQNADGGWGWTVGGNSDADNTAAAISALVAAGETPGSQTIVKALGYLKTQQQNNGGFVSEGVTNSAVSSWVINALASVEQSPVAGEWRKSGNNPIGHLLSLQDTDGAFKWSATQRTDPQWMTAYAIPALLGKAYPGDTLPPKISNITPASGTTVTGTSVVISAGFTDTISGIDSTTARLKLDGNVVEASVGVSNIIYTADNLSSGTHSVVVSVSDRCGNQATRSWSFRVTTSGGVGGGGGAAVPTTTPTPTLPPGTTSVSRIIHRDGVFTQSVNALSQDGNCTLAINAGTKGLTASGQALSQISVVPMTDPPVSPAQSSIIGLTYDLGPDGATFDPPVVLTFSYDDSQIPQGIDEERLTIALWDTSAGQWVELISTIDPITNRISASISHFSAYTVLAYTRPANIILSNLSISPAEVSLNEAVNVSVRAANEGDLTGSYELALDINGVVEQKEIITLSGGESRVVNFTVTGDIAGIYSLIIGDLQGTLTVKMPQTPADFSISSLTVNPPEAIVGEPIEFMVIVANTGDFAGAYRMVLKLDNTEIVTREVSLAGGASEHFVFPLIAEVPGLHVISVNDISAPFMVKTVSSPPPASSKSNLPVEPVNWLFIGGIAGGLIVAGILIFLIISRRRH